MRRREFLTAFCSVVVNWPLSVRAQQTPEIVPKVGFVYPGSKEAVPSRIEAMMSGLRVSGYSAPAQVELVVRIADGDPARIAPLVEEIVAKNVTMIIANGVARGSRCDTNHSDCSNRPRNRSCGEWYSCQSGASGRKHHRCFSRLPRLHDEMDRAAD